MVNLGYADYEIEAEAPAAEEITQLVRGLNRLLSKEISRVEIMQVFRHLKYARYPFRESR